MKQPAHNTAATHPPRLYLLPSPVPTRWTLSPRIGYAVAVLVVGLGLFASVTPSPLYRTYSGWLRKGWPPAPARTPGMSSQRPGAPSTQPSPSPHRATRPKRDYHRSVEEARTRGPPLSLPVPTRD